WLLTGLAILPAIWWLIRLTPPAPKIIKFPAIQFLLHLHKDEKSTDSIPWWLLILRLLIAALIIIGLAAPALNLPTTGKRDGPAVLIVDNGWTSAPSWKQREATLKKLVQDLSSQQRLIYIIPTAAGSAEEKVPFLLLKPENASSLDLDLNLKPKSWSLNRDKISSLLPKFKNMEDIEFFWLSDGLVANADLEKVELLLSNIADIGPLTIYRDDTKIAPHVIGTPAISNNSLSVPVVRATGSRNDHGTLIGRADNGKILLQKPYSIDQGKDSVNLLIDLPSEIRNDIAQFEIKGTNSAGARFLLDNRWQRREIGLVADVVENLGQSLLSETHYLEKALTPYYDIRKTALDDLLKSTVSLIALGDVAAFSAKMSANLKSWISKGGVLIRFSGPKLANSHTDLTPVELRSGNRNLDGSMSWSTPAALGPMPKGSPFANLTIDPDIKINKQVLANPSAILNNKTWARLEDGTPLVTADKRGKGWIILFHTTATTSWSDLVLSGLFVEMLREIGHLGTINNTGILAKKHLPPLDLLDGFGNFEGRIQTAKPLDTAINDMSSPIQDHPAGFYGNNEYKIALNIGPGLETYETIDYSRIPGSHKSYTVSPIISLQAPLLVGALCLILLDILIALFLQGRFSKSSTYWNFKSIWILIPLVIFFGLTNLRNGYAEESIQRLLQATLETRLAYVLTGDTSVDRMSEAGLRGLSEQLRRRTAIDAANPLAVNIETNELIFFPMIYWPVTADFPTISDTAISKINNYLKGGGTILFDTRDQYSTGNFGTNSSGSPEAARLRNMLLRLDIPNLSSVPVDHVLTRAFYLMQSFPGRYSDGELWIENTNNAVGNDGVASVLIGSNDWAAAWATDANGRPLAAVIPGGKRQREMATRFGINLVMYTLAGNYKADQVHIPTILERLGQ
ncbi:MAG: DUF4159 domain-containing protein, partial [Sneathiella sp.]|nr:DUF4159 domain-containing protein [Sneathiella sp.]